MKANLHSVQCPEITVRVDVVGSNSLLGSLCKALQERDLLKHINVLHPDKIVFSVKRVHKKVNLFEEINTVVDFLKIKREKISLFIE